MLVLVLCRLSAANIVHLDDFGKYSVCVAWWLCVCLWRCVWLRYVFGMYFYSYLTEK